MSNLHLASPVRSNGKVRCFRHENLLERQVSKTLANPNRGFYSCDASVGTDGESCDFFKWEDEMSPPPSPSPSRKRPASLLEDDLAHKRPNTSQNTTRSPASQARYEAIMRSSRQGTSVTPSPSPANTSTAGPSTAVHRPVTPTPKTEEQDWSPHTPPPSAPQSTTTPTSQKGSDSSRKRYEAMLRATGRSATSATPPSSPSPFLAAPATPPPTKERAEALGKTPASSSLLASEHDRNATSSSNGRGTLGTPTEVFHVTDNLSPAVREYMEWSNRTAAHIVDLERRLSAAEENNSAKAERIDQLEREINRLKERNAELEGGVD